MADIPFDKAARIDEWRAKAFKYSATNRLGHVLKSAFELMLTTVQQGPESSAYAIQSLDRERLHVMKEDSQRDVPLHDLIYGVCECLGYTIQSSIERREGTVDASTMPEVVQTTRVSDGIQQLAAPVISLPTTTLGWQQLQQMQPQQKAADSNATDTPRTQTKVHFEAARNDSVEAPAESAASVASAAPAAAAASAAAWIGEPAFQCELCGSTFVGPAALGENRYIQSIIVFKCSSCQNKTLEEQKMQKQQAVVLAATAAAAANATILMQGNKAQLSDVYNVECTAGSQASHLNKFTKSASLESAQKTSQKISAERDAAHKDFTRVIAHSASSLTDSITRNEKQAQTRVETQPSEVLNDERSTGNQEHHLTETPKPLHHLIPQDPTARIVQKIKAQAQLDQQPADVSELNAKSSTVDQAHHLTEPPKTSIIPLALTGDGTIADRESIQAEREEKQPIDRMRIEIEGVFADDYEEVDEEWDDPDYKPKIKKPKIKREGDKKQMECPLCTLRTFSINTLNNHLRNIHQSTPYNAGIAFRCDCGHVSRSTTHVHSECTLLNFTIIPGEMKPIRKDAPKCIKCETPLPTVNGYIQHLHYHHKTTLNKCGIHLRCSCGLLISHGGQCTAEHRNTCGGQYYTVYRN